MFPIDRERTLTLRQASELLPGNPNRSTMHRWTHRGVRGVRLATIGRRYTTREALQAFIAALSKV